MSPANTHNVIDPLPLLVNRTGSLLTIGGTTATPAFWCDKIIIDGEIMRRVEVPLGEFDTQEFAIREHGEDGYEVFSLSGEPIRPSLLSDETRLEIEMALY